MIFLTDKYNNANLIDHTRVKSIRVVRSVLRAKTFALPGPCDATIITQKLFEAHFGKTLKITILTDSATLFNDMMRNEPTTEKQLKIGINVSTETYKEEIKIT